ncbi:ABC transporter permease [Nonomuraea sp. K274]|uniref:ABC transporter permease n=1 Tax=Nonomuraea cypriaca TaxID=1187855 RepID=A0A931A161_9ACTN|nr:ABC transporter permease [Nonomuraea cypriaca]MBF8184286.1 ABC transporter permease [Nonomuraea cypriaca]
MTAAAIDVAPPVPRSRSGTAFWLSVAFLVVVIGCGLLAPWIAPHDPTDADLGASLQGISGAHWLGTDQSGQDIASRLMYGVRTGLLSPLLILAFALVFGPPIGILAAWKGGWVDTAISRATDAGIAFPGLLFAVLMIAVFGEGIASAVIALGLAYTPAVSKLARSAALAECRKEYVEAYRVLGVGGMSICLRRLTPRVIPLILGYCVVLFGEALMSMAALSYLGLGAQPPASDWGLMVSEGQLPLIQGALLPSLAPGAAIALTVVAFNVVGVRLADKLGVDR